MPSGGAFAPEPGEDVDHADEPLVIVPYPASVPYPPSNTTPGYWAPGRGGHSCGPPPGWNRKSWGRACRIATSPAGAVGCAAVTLQRIGVSVVTIFTSNRRSLDGSMPGLAPAQTADYFHANRRVEWGDEPSLIGFLSALTLLGAAGYGCCGEVLGSGSTGTGGSSVATSQGGSSSNVAVSASSGFGGDSSGQSGISAVSRGATIDSIVSQLQQAPDILEDGTHEPARLCGGISIGIGFTATAVSLGDTGPASPMPPF